MKYFKLCLLFIFHPFISPIPTQAQDSTFITDRYKWELGIGLNAGADPSKPISLILKKHVSARTAWRFGLGFNYDRVYDKDLPIIEDLDLTRIFIAYEIDRKETKQIFSLSTGIQRNYSLKNMNLYCALDFIIDYQFHKIYSPDGIRYLDVRIPDGTSYTLFKENTKTGYGLSLKPLIGLAYPITRRFSFSIETSILYRAIYNRSRDFYYSVSSISGNINYGFTSGIYDKNWTYHLNFNLIPFITFNYHFD